MMAVDHNYAIAVFQLSHVVDVVHWSRACRTFAVEDRRKVVCRHVTRMVVVILSERRRRRAAVCFIVDSRRVTRV